jgi:hypothetical protein
MSNTHPKFEILCNTKDDDSYMYSDTDYSWFVVSKQTGDALVERSGHWYQRRSGDSTGGVSSMSFSEQGEAVVARGFDESIERIELPADVRVVADGASIELTWPDGRTETRKRNEALVGGKFGGVFSLKELVSPPT